MIDFLTIVLLIFGVLQIILFFKVWGMTNNVKKIQEQLQPKVEDHIIIEAQLKALNGKKEEAFALYQKAFYLNIIELYNKTVNEYGDDMKEYSERDSYYESYYSSIMKYYSKRVEKLDMNLITDNYNSFPKVSAIISKL